MKKLLVILLSALSIQLSAQTKLIAHKSHSGSEETFKAAYINELFDINSSNYGVAPDPIIRTAYLDSVIFISESMAILVTHDTCHRKTGGKLNAWKPGREIVNNHPLFSKQHSLDSIKQVLDMTYFFANPASTVVFIGYDNGNSSSPGKSKENSVPLIGIDNNKPFGNMFILVMMTGIFSLVAGWAWKRLNNRSAGNTIRVHE